MFVGGICTGLATSKLCSHQKCILKMRMLFQGMIFQGQQLTNQPPKPFSHRHKYSEVIPAPSVQCAFIGVFWPPVTLPGVAPGTFLLSPGLPGALLGQSLANHSIAVDMEGGSGGQCLQSGSLCPVLQRQEGSACVHRATVNDADSFSEASWSIVPVLRIKSLAITVLYLSEISKNQHISLNHA